jgi:hypothetical protein
VQQDLLRAGAQHRVATPQHHGRVAGRAAHGVADGRRGGGQHPEPQALDDGGRERAPGAHARAVQRGPHRWDSLERDAGHDPRGASGAVLELGQGRDLHGWLGVQYGTNGRRSRMAVMTPRLYPSGTYRRHRAGEYPPRDVR